MLYVFQAVDLKTEYAIRSTHPFVGQMVKLMETVVGSMMQSDAMTLL